MHHSATQCLFGVRLGYALLKADVSEKLASCLISPSPTCLPLLLQGLSGWVRSCPHPQQPAGGVRA